MEPGMDRMGGDYKGFALSSADPQLCRVACEQDNACKAYTYVRPGLKGPQAMCFLKSELVPSSPSDCCTSGAKTAEPGGRALPIVRNAAPTRAIPVSPRVIRAPAVTPAADGPQIATVLPGTLLVLGPPKPCAALHVNAAMQGGQHDGSLEFPFATINAAIASATARQCSLNIVLAPGTYVEDITVEAYFKLKGADKANTKVQGSLRAIGNFQTELSDVGFVNASPLAIYKEGGKIEMHRVAVNDIKFDPGAGSGSPGAVQIVNATGVVTGLVTDDTNSPALLVEGPAARIKAFGLVVSNSAPAVEVTTALRSIGAVEIRDNAAVMGSLWEIFNNQFFGVVVTTGASLYLSNATVKDTHTGTSFGPDNLLVASGGIMEIDHVASTGAGRAGALVTMAFFTAHRSKLQSNKYGFVYQSDYGYSDPTAAYRCGTEDEVLITANSEQGIVSTGGSLPIPNAPLCTPAAPCADEPPPPDMQACKLALRW